MTPEERRKLVDDVYKGAFWGFIICVILVCIFVFLGI